MTFKTSLVLAGDDAGMSDVLAKADKALEQLERSTASLARAQAAAKSETDAAKAAYKSGELTLEQYNRTIIDSKTALSLFEERHRRAAAEVKSFGAVANVSTGQAKAGYINLGRQMQDQVGVDGLEGCGHLGSVADVEMTEGGSGPAPRVGIPQIDVGGDHPVAGPDHCGDEGAAEHPGSSGGEDEHVKHLSWGERG